MSEGARHTGGTESTGETAKEEVGRLTEDIKHEAGRVADEARQQGREMMDETKQRLREEADRQTGRTASGLKSMSSELRSMADHTEQPESSVATWVRRGADEIDSFANRLDRDGFDGVARDVSDFARRNPTTFLLTSLGAGVLVGRLMKNMSGDRMMQEDGRGKGDDWRATRPNEQSSQEISPASLESGVTGRTSP